MQPHAHPNICCPKLEVLGSTWHMLSVVQLQSVVANELTLNIQACQQCNSKPKESLES